MELIVKSLISALFVGTLGLVITVQHKALKVAKERVEHAEQATRDRDDTLKALMQAATRNKQAAAKLEAARDSIAATLTERENQLESLNHDNPTIRTWAESPLPDAIAGLRQHPAITGADADSQRLPSDHALPVAGGGAKD